LSRGFSGPRLPLGLFLDHPVQYRRYVVTVPAVTHLQRRDSRDTQRDNARIGEDLARPFTVQFLAEQLLDHCLTCRDIRIRFQGEPGRVEPGYRRPQPIRVEPHLPQLLCQALPALPQLSDRRRRPSVTVASRRLDRDFQRCPCPRRPLRGHPGAAGPDDLRAQTFKLPGRVPRGRAHWYWLSLIVPSGHGATP
jgi:hypothetical protein